jgi:hypothetical protein
MSPAAVAARDLVDLVDEDDAGLFDALHGGAADRFHVEQFGLLLGGDLLERFGHLEAARLGAPAEQVAHHVLQVDADLFDRGAGNHFERRHRRRLHIELHGAIVQPSFTQLFAHPLARAP